MLLDFKLNENSVDLYKYAPTFWELELQMYGIFEGLPELLVCKIVFGQG